MSSIDDRSVNTHYCSFTSDQWQRIAHQLRLNTREYEIVREVFQGKTDAAIVLKLGIADGTLRTYVSRLHTKLHVHDRPELILRVVGARK